MLLRADRPLPPLAAVAARPLLLLLAALLGATAATFTIPDADYAASAVLQFSNTGSDSLRVKQVGQTVERLAVSSRVVGAAAQARRLPAPSLAQRVTAEWQPDSDLVVVTVTGPDGPSASADADAVAAAAIRSNIASVQLQLRELRQASNRLLTVERLADPAAEAARRTQLGAALASRQETVNAQNNGLFIADRATGASLQGLSSLTRALVGMLAGLLLGALAAVLLGNRGLRLFGPARVNRILPGLVTLRPDQAAEVAGQLVESNTACLAVVNLPGALLETSRSFALDVADYVGVHGRSVRVVVVDELADEVERRAALRRGARTDVRGAFGTDVVVLVVDSSDPGFAMLVGQAGFTACIVGARRTRLQSLLAATAKLDRARPVALITP